MESFPKIWKLNNILLSKLPLSEDTEKPVRKYLELNDNTLAEPCKEPKVICRRNVYQMPPQQRGKCLKSISQPLPEKVIKEKIKSKLNRRK